MKRTQPVADPEQASRMKNLENTLRLLKRVELERLVGFYVGSTRSDEQIKDEIIAVILQRTFTRRD